MTNLHPTYDELQNIIQNENLSEINETISKYTFRLDFLNKRLNSSYFYKSHHELENEVGMTKKAFLEFINKKEKMLTKDFYLSLISSLNK